MRFSTLAFAGVATAALLALACNNDDYAAESERIREERARDEQAREKAASTLRSRLEAVRGALGEGEASETCPALEGATAFVIDGALLEYLATGEPRLTPETLAPGVPAIDSWRHLSSASLFALREMDRHQVRLDDARAKQLTETAGRAATDRAAALRELEKRLPKPAPTHAVVLSAEEKKAPRYAVGTFESGIVRGHASLLSLEGPELLCRVPFTARNSDTVKVEVTEHTVTGDGAEKDLGDNARKAVSEAFAAAGARLELAP